MRHTVVSMIVLASFLGACGSSAATQSGATPTPRPPAPAMEKQTYTVEVGDVVDEIKVSGTVAAIKQEELAFEQSGFVKVVNIERNDIITKGMVLAELDLGDMPNQLQQAEVNYTQVKIQYDRSGTQRDLGRQRAELDLAEANANLDRLVNPRASDIATARATLEAARANMASTTANANNDVERAQSDLNTAQRNLPLIQEAYSQALYDWDGVKNDEKHAQYDRRRQAYVDAQNALDAGTTAMNNANQTLIAAKANRQPLIDGAAATLQRAQIAYDQLTKTPDPDAIASAQRAAGLPDVPTTAEAGLPGFTLDAWFGFAVPAATPRPIQEKLNAVINAAAEQASVRERAQAGGATTKAMSLTELDTLARREVEELGAVIRAAGITLE